MECLRMCRSLSGPHVGDDGTDGWLGQSSEARHLTFAVDDGEANHLVAESGESNQRGQIITFESNRILTPPIRGLGLEIGDGAMRVQASPGRGRHHT